jgi:hypothetical protein
MQRISATRKPVSKGRMALMIPASLVALSCGIALAAQDRYSLKVPNGLAFSDFEGYQDWRDVAVSQTEHGIKVISANDAAIQAYRSGVPGDGKLFPDGSKFAKIEWTFKKNPESPYFVNIPDTLKSLSFIEKNLNRFPNTHGWAFAQWDYDAATETFKPSELSASGAECGYACHSKVAAQDYIFTAYPKR